MDDLLWDEVQVYFDPDLMGALPDLLVPGASIDDWQAVLDLIDERGWQHQYSDGQAVAPVPRAETVLSRAPDAASPDLRVWFAADALAIFRFHSADEIDFDVDLREFQGQDRFDLFCEFLCAIGRQVAKPVLMSSEGGDGHHPLLGFDVECDRVVLLAEPFENTVRT